MAWVKTDAATTAERAHKSDKIMLTMSASSVALDSETRPSQLWIFAGFGALAIGFAIFSLAGALGQKSGGAAIETLPLVETVSAESRGARYRVHEDGFLRPVQEIDIVPEVAGKIVSVNPRFTLGGRFKAGETLFEIDPTTFEAQRSQARADLSRVRATLESVRLTYGRQEELKKEGFAAQSRLDQAEADLASALAAVAQAQAQLAIADKQLADTRITAPFDARVQRENVSLGQYVAPGNPVGRLYSDTEAEIIVSLSPQEANAVRRAQAETPDTPLIAEISRSRASAGNVALTGRVVEISRALDPQTRTVDILVRIDNAFAETGPDTIYAQDFVTVSLPARSATPVYLTEAGVLRKQGYVWTLSDENRLKKVDVAPVEQRGQRIAIASTTDLSRERLVVTTLTEETEGMQVRVGAADPSNRAQRLQGSGPAKATIRKAER